MNAPCPTCKYAKKAYQSHDGLWSFFCTWEPTFSVAETWTRKTTPTVAYNNQLDCMFFRDDASMFKTCGAWEEKEAVE